MSASTADTLKHHIKVNVNNTYEASWSNDINNVKANPGLRVYRKINQSLNLQSYLDKFKIGLVNYFRKNGGDPTATDLNFELYHEITLLALFETLWRISADI